MRGHVFGYGLCLAANGISFWSYKFVCLPDVDFQLTTIVCMELKLNSKDVESFGAGFGLEVIERSRIFIPFSHLTTKRSDLILTGVLIYLVL